MIIGANSLCINSIDTNEIINYYDKINIILAEKNKEMLNKAITILESIKEKYSGVSLNLISRINKDVFFDKDINIALMFELERLFAFPSIEFSDVEYDAIVAYNAQKKNHNLTKVTEDFKRFALMLQNHEKIDSAGMSYLVAWLLIKHHSVKHFADMWIKEYGVIEEDYITNYCLREDIDYKDKSIVGAFTYYLMSLGYYKSDSFYENNQVLLIFF